MSQDSERRAQEFLQISDQFKLGALTTEASHPVTAQLSEVARIDVAGALDLLFDVDEDVLRRYARWVESGEADTLQAQLCRALRAGGRLLFTGCGSTGRLSIQLVSIWREFWQRYPACPGASDLEGRAFSVMAGGDFALIKAVEGFEDYTAFGRKQIADLGVGAGDVVFAITEGGETSFVIGTAWEGLDRGAAVNFVYNNPDEVLRERVERSRQVLEEPRIRKLNLTTGPMAITGSTRMQATSIQLSVLLTVLEMVVRELLPEVVPGSPHQPAGEVPRAFLAAMRQAYRGMRSERFRRELAGLVGLEEKVYRAGGRVNYFADAWAIDLLTDTTERSPTYCTPPFRKADDPGAADSWAFLFVPQPDTVEAWRQMLRREPQCVEWSRAEVESLLDASRAARSFEVIQGISRAELMRFKVGMDGLPTRPVRPVDAVVVVSGPADGGRHWGEGGAFGTQLRMAGAAGAGSGVLALGFADSPEPVAAAGSEVRAYLPLPRTDFLLEPVGRVALKMVLNALSTCVMVQLGRVLGNYMVWVVPSNLKLIDRATRYIVQLTGLSYEAANRLLFEVIEYIEPRMRAGRAYPPAVAMAVLRAKRTLSNEAAEAALAATQG